MEELINLLNNVEGDKPITAELLSEKMLDFLTTYNDEDYDPQGYKGHHAFLISNTLKDFFSISDESAGITTLDYKGLGAYQGELTEETSFNQFYDLLDVAFKRYHEVSRHGDNDTLAVMSFSSAVDRAFNALNDVDVLSPGEYFYMFNALKKVREEYVDDYI